MNNKKLIVVLGMHRSGTSAITKSLELFGVGLGSNLYPAGFDNPKGFWEEQECININDELLEHLGSAYDRLGLALVEMQLDTQLSELKLRAIKLIQQKLQENNGIWGFKDPRTCRLLDFWNKVFLEIDCEVNFVIVIRNPASVAASLATRNSMPAEKAYFLWLQHVLPSLNFTKDAKRVVVDYDEFMANPYSQLLRISSVIGLPLPSQDNDLVKDFEDNFLDCELIHTRFTEVDLALDNCSPKMVIETYSLLKRLAIDQELLESSSVQLTIDELNARLIEVSPALDYINTLEDERMALWLSVGKRDSQISNLNQIVGERDSKIADLNQVVGERDSKIADLNQVVAERDSKIADLNQVVAERDSQISSLTTEKKHILSSISWKITKPLRFFGRNFVNPLYFSVRQIFSHSTRQLWFNLPLPNQKKTTFQTQVV